MIPWFWDRAGVGMQLTLPRQLFAIAVPKTAGVIECEFVDALEQSGSCLLGRQLTGEVDHAGFHHARVQLGDSDAARLEVHGKGAAQRVEGRLGSAVEIGRASCRERVESW